MRYFILMVLSAFASYTIPHICSVRHREWLKSVLYINHTDPQYFCLCVLSINSTFFDINANIAIFRWMEEHSVCNRHTMWVQDSTLRAVQLANWREGDTTKPL